MSSDKVAFISAIGSGDTLIKGIPTFLWTVWYTQTEGVMPYVLTDSRRVAQVCTGFGIRYMHVPLSWRNFEDLAETLGVEYYAVLSCDYPFHEPGVLVRCFEKVTENIEGGYAYTTDATGNKDGSIYVFRSSKRAAIGLAVQTVPLCNRRITTTGTSDGLNYLAGYFPETVWYMPTPIRKIALVENAVGIDRDYSAFIDRCDLVARENKCCNLPSGRVGKRTDLALITANDWYTKMYSDKRCNIDKLKDTPLVYVSTSAAKLDRLTQKYITPQDRFLSVYFKQGFTISCAAVDFLCTIFPEAVIYIIGHKTRWDMVTAHYHNVDKEQTVIDSLRDLGRVEYVDEEGKADTECVYSEPAGNTLPIVAEIWEVNICRVLKEQPEAEYVPYWLYPDGTYRRTSDYEEGKYNQIGKTLVIQPENGVTERTYEQQLIDIKGHPAYQPI